jgi:hypothetical protein
VKANALDADGLTRIKYFSALTTKGDSSTKQNFELTMVDSFSSYSTSEVSSEGSCAILCSKDKENPCIGFVVAKEDGILNCKMIESLSTSVAATGGDQIYKKSIIINC